MHTRPKGEARPCRGRGSGLDTRRVRHADERQEALAAGSSDRTIAGSRPAIGTKLASDSGRSATFSASSHGFDSRRKYESPVAQRQEQLPDKQQTRVQLSAGGPTACSIAANASVLQTVHRRFESSHADHFKPPPGRCSVSRIKRMPRIKFPPQPPLFGQGHRAPQPVWGIALPCRCDVVAAWLVANERARVRFSATAPRGRNITIVCLPSKQNARV